MVKGDPKDRYDVRPEQSVALLQALHILTREGKLNQDSRRKLKQVYHLMQFIQPLLQENQENAQDARELCVVDHGAGKSYLGFLLYDFFFKSEVTQGRMNGHIYGIETRQALVEKSQALAQQLNFSGMSFLNLSVAESIHARQLPDQVDLVTALHACDTATDDAIHFALKKRARHMVLVPCCQAEVAALLRKTKAHAAPTELYELWRRPLHAREFGSHLTNVLRCLQLEAHGYQVTVTELVGWEHSLKNELIIAQDQGTPNRAAAQRLHDLLDRVGLGSLRERFFTPIW